jgi:dTDP-4-amino-4,6-dideoxygalactose transaminase
MSHIHLSKADTTELEEAFVLDAIHSGWVAPLGPHVDAFEAEVAHRVGVTGALALSSGTAALHLALLGVGAGPGTVVPVSSMTFAASATAITYTGARPVFIDSQACDGNLDPHLLLKAIDTLRSEGETVAAATRRTHPQRRRRQLLALTIVLDPTHTTVTPKQLMTDLANENIESRRLWKPMHLQPVFTTHRSFTNGHSAQLFNQGLTLPGGSALQDHEIERVIKTVKSAWATGRSTMGSA